MHRRLVTLSALLWLFPAVAHCEGFVTIDGKLSGGREVIVDMETSSVWLWHRSAKGEISRAREFKGQGCSVVHEDENPKRRQRILTCPSGGSTPLAGTHYVGKPTNGNCWKGAPEFVYTCTSGCGPRSPAPKRLTQAHWEC